MVILSSERPIASLRVGDPVLAYDPATGQQTTQTIVTVFLNHDHDRLDVTLALPSSHAAPGGSTAGQSTQDAETARERARAVAGHGLRAPPDAAATIASATSATASTEVIHTTANHPWLTAVNLRLKVHHCIAAKLHQLVTAKRRHPAGEPSSRGTLRCVSLTWSLRGLYVVGAMTTAPSFPSPAPSPGALCAARR